MQKIKFIGGITITAIVLFLITTYGRQQLTEPKPATPYNSALNTTYITAQEWPPSVSFDRTPFDCTPSTTMVQKVLKGKTYCVTTESEGAAGSTYTTYTYRTMLGDRRATVSFVLRFPQCMNYDDPQQSQCLAEQKSFDPDAIAQGLITHTDK